MASAKKLIKISVISSLAFLGVVMLGYAGLSIWGVSLLFSMVQDDAAIFSHDQLKWIAQYHNAIRQAYDIDLRVNTVAGTDDIATYAARLFVEMEVGEYSDDGYGLLLVIDPVNDNVRFEVSRGLEGIYTDGFVRYIEERQMVPFFQAERIADGILATTEMIATRAQEGQEGKAFDAPSSTGFERSSGAGAQTRAQIGSGYQRPNSDISQHSIDKSGGPTSIVNAYLKAMEAGNANPSLSIYSEGTKRMMQEWVVTAAQMKNMVRAYRKCPEKREFIKENFAVIRFNVNKRQCSPYFLVREDGGWKLDLTHMSNSIRFNHKNLWRFSPSPRPPSHYTFAFSDWQFDKKGYPYSQ